MPNVKVELHLEHLNVGAGKFQHLVLNQHYKGKLGSLMVFSFALTPLL